MPKLQDLTNKKFGKLFVISRGSNSSQNRVRWLCQCDCGNKKEIIANSLKSGRTISCGCMVNRTGNNNPTWKGVGDLSSRFFNTFRQNANGIKTKKKKEFTITIEYAWELFEKQKQRCAISGIELSLSDVKNKCTPTASIDRIDSNKGYIPGNIQWVHKDINIMKNIYDQEYFISICKLIAVNNK